MNGVLEKAIPLAVAIVMGLYTQHPLTWRTELIKLEYSILKEVKGTSSWGCPSVFDKDACGEYRPERYR
jgi:hypothetical protein